MAVTRVALREELIFLLNEAAELEQSLCCSYLFTAFSLKSSLEEGLTDETLGVVRRWKRVITDIAVEEMLHLAVVNDLLVAVGSAPNFDRPNFPSSCYYFMPDLDIELFPFGESALRQFMAVEQPSGGNLPLEVDPNLPERVEGSLDNEIGPDPYFLSSQGDVYDLVLDGLRDMVARMGEAKVFLGPPPKEAMRRFFQSYGWEPVRDLAAAERALAHVVEQGEGGKATGVDSHHSRFGTVLSEYLELKQKIPAFEPAFPALSNPFSRTPPEANGPVNLIEDEFAIKISDLFNEVYTSMLQLLARFFAATDETEEEAAALCDAAVEAMAGAVVPLGELLMRLPAGKSNPNLNAGPSFVVRTLHPMPHKEAARKLLLERFEELRDYASKLAVSGHAAAPMQKVGEALARVANILS